MAVVFPAVVLEVVPVVVLRRVSLARVARPGLATTARSLIRDSREPFEDCTFSSVAPNPRHTRSPPRSVIVIRQIRRAHTCRFPFGKPDDDHDA